MKNNKKERIFLLLLFQVFVNAFGYFVRKNKWRTPSLAQFRYEKPLENYEKLVE